MFLIQDGHQQHTRVASAISSGLADGVVWSLGDTGPNTLPDAMSEAGSTIQAIDPQLYVAPLQDANPKKLTAHELFEVPLALGDFSPSSVISLTRSILDFQISLPVSHLIAPTVPFESINSRWAQVASDLASSATEHVASDARPLMVSVAVQESVLSDQDNVDALLDELTTYTCAGFYVLFELNPQGDPAEAALKWERALYIVHTLSILNDFEVWVGYAGMGGFAFRAVGASAFGAGWFQKQQWWSTSHWTASGGGRQPRPRVFLDTVLGSLVISGEVALVARQETDADLFNDLIAAASGPVAARLTESRSFDDDFSRDELNAQLFATCRAVDDRLTGQPENDLRTFRDQLAAARSLLQRVREADIELDSRSRNTILLTWQAAVISLGSRLGYDL